VPGGRTRLNPLTPLHAGVYLPDDEVGNCRQFAHLLRREAQRRGARFRFHTDVSQIIGSPQPTLVHTYAPPDEAVLLSATGDSSVRPFQDTQPIAMRPFTQSFDAVVVCAALGAPALLRPHGLKLPLLAVHGYSITAPLRLHETHPDHGPRSGLMDERYKVAITRLGSRVRWLAAPRSALAAASPRRRRGDALQGAARLVPRRGATEPGSALERCRSMLPDGPPVLGRSGIDGVWLNLGHGSSGWALACGSARLLADGWPAELPPSTPRASASSA